MHSGDLGQKFRLGLIVIGILALFTAAEYWVAVSWSVAVVPGLAVAAIVKAWLILRYFMHMPQLWHPEEE